MRGYDTMITYLQEKLNYNISIHQTACKNKAKPFKCTSNYKVKFITLFDHEELQS